MTSPNQRTIVIDKTDVSKGSGTTRPFLVEYNDIIENAAQLLNGNAFKLYIYLLCNKKGFHIGFSPKDVAESFGCSTDTVRTSFTTLVNNGFLTLANGSKSKYIFTDVPNKQLEESIQPLKTENIETIYTHNASKEFHF